MLRAKHVGEAINILQEATHNAYDPEEVLTVIPVTLTVENYLSTNLIQSSRSHLFSYLKIGIGVS